MAVGSAIGWVVTGLDAMNQRDTLDAYRREVAGAMGPGPICDFIDRGNAAQVDACTNDVPMILQFVFMGVTAVAGGIGVGLLAINGPISAAPDQDHVRLRLMPSFTSQSAYLGVGVDF